MHKKALGILACSVCRSSIELREDRLICLGSNHHEFQIDGNIALMLPSSLPDDLELSKKKWDSFYRGKRVNHDYGQLHQRYLEDNFDNVFQQINRAKSLKGKVFLEIGCGPFILGQMIAKDCNLVIGIDFSYPALKMAEAMLTRKGIGNFLLVLGDVRKMPLRDGCVDILYGGGVLEHFIDTQQAVNEFYRVVKSEGISFNTVPFLNLGSLSYRQVWGNIPNLPLLKQLAELVHIKLLGTRHMTFGYELSFTAEQLIKMHKKAGFKEVSVEKFETKLMFDFIPFKFLKRFFISLANNCRFFWPMVKVVAEK